MSRLTHFERRAAQILAALGSMGFVGCHSANDVTFALIPRFEIDSLMSAGTSALVGTISDSVSGRALVSGAQIRVTLRGDSAIQYSSTDNKGGFVIRRLTPGKYSYLARAVGYMPAYGELTLQARHVDTLRFRLARSPFGGEWEKP